MYERDWQPLWDLGIAGALLVGGLLLCNQPVDLPRRDDDAVTFVNVGTELSQSGRIDDAVTMWQLALAEDARIPETYHHLGRAALAARGPVRRRTSRCSTFFCQVIAKKCSSTPSQGPTCSTP